MPDEFRRLEWDDFVTEFRPMIAPVNPGGELEGYLHATYGPDWEAVQVAGRHDPNTIWTVVDYNEENVANAPYGDYMWDILPGFHIVNRLGFLVCEVPRTTDAVEGTY
jgi:hypothetical protein